MIKDIEFPKIEGVTVAVAYEKIKDKDNWVVLVINENNFQIDNLLVVSKGYGTVKEETVKTSTLRRFFEVVPAESSQQIEPIPNELVVLSNEYWISFYINKKVFDKKFVFTAGVLSTQFLTQLPVLNQQGILHS